jgi:hypothetical protein
MVTMVNARCQADWASESWPQLVLTLSNSLDGLGKYIGCTFSGPYYSDLQNWGWTHGPQFSLGSGNSRPGGSRAMPVCWERGGEA